MNGRENILNRIGLNTRLSQEIVSHVLRYAGPLLLVSTGAGLLFLASPLYMLQIYDRVITTGSLNTLGFLTAITVFCLGCMAVFDFLRGRALCFLAASLYDRFAPTVLRRSGLQAVQSTRTEILGLRELETVKVAVSGTAATCILDAPIVPIFFAAILFISPVLAGIVLLGGICLVTIAVFSDRATRKQMVSAHGDGIAAHQFADDIANAADYFLATGRLNSLVDAFGQKVRRQQQGLVSIQRVPALSNSTSKALRLLIQVALLGIGGLLVIEGAVTPGAVIACSIIGARALAPIEQSIGAWHQIQGARQSLAVLGRMEAFRAPERPAFELPPKEGRLSLQGVGYRHQGAAKALLAGLTLDCEPGKLLAIVGDSGAGKTTLCRMLTGLTPPTTGTVAIDGVALRHWPEHQLAGLIGYLPQSARFITGTVADNIAGFDPSLGSNAIVAAAEMCGAHDLITRLPNGYETQIGAGGIALSGGQKQLIALARTLAHDPQILILDEPTASLDRGARERFGAFLKRCVLANKTLVLVTHDQDLARICDHALILRDGRHELRQNDQLAISALVRRRDDAKPLAS